MEGIDYQTAFCVVHATDASAQEAFEFEQNSSFLVRSTTSNPEAHAGPPPLKKLRTMREATPEIGVVPSVRLALRFDPAAYRDVQTGVTFGSDEETCDILLSKDKKSKISAIHFSIRWDFTIETDPWQLFIANRSAKNVLWVDYETLLPGKWFGLSREKPTFVSVGMPPLCMKIEVPDYRSKEDYEMFLQNWEVFEKDVRSKIPTFGDLKVSEKKVIEETPEDRELLSGYPLGSSAPEYPPEDFHPRYLEYGDVLGVGMSGTVVKATSRKSPTVIAVKRLDATMEKHMKREIDILKSTSHPHIVHCIASFEVNDRVEIMLEYAHGGNLGTYIDELRESNLRASEADTIHVAYQALDALAYLHARNIIHRDVKAENILIFDEDTLWIKLADFGMSRTLAESTALNFAGTSGYVAPELTRWHVQILRTGQRVPLEYSHAIDIFSLAATIFRFFTFRTPYEARPRDFRPTVETLVEDATQDPINLRELRGSGMSPRGIDFLGRMLDRDAGRRLTAPRCLQHPWFFKKRPTADAGPST